MHTYNQIHIFSTKTKEISPHYYFYGDNDLDLHCARNSGIARNAPQGQGGPHDGGFQRSNICCKNSQICFE